MFSGSQDSDRDPWIDETNWVDLDGEPASQTARSESPVNSVTSPHLRAKTPVVMVETAFLASTASLIWLINYYFPLGPLLRIFFPIPIALVYMRRGRRAAWMAALVSGLLLSILMGPNRSILFVIPFGVMGVQLGVCWRSRWSWCASMTLGMLLGAFGFFFRFWLLSLVLGEDMWRYGINQIAGLADWIFIKLGLMAQPETSLIQAIALAMILLNNLLYVFVVHLVALFLFDRLGNPIPKPPHWVQALVEYDD